MNETSVCNKIARPAIPCSHEEADSRIFVHLQHAVEHDCVTTACVLSNDTDIIVIAISFFHQLKLQGLQKLWVSFGNGEQRRWFPIHDLATHLGETKSKGLPFFHAFCGCDSVSGFRGKGKKSFLQMWNSLSDITETFLKLSTFPISVDGGDIQKLEHFVALLYDKSSTSTSIDTTRKELFMQRGVQWDHLPPTSEALKQHILRAAYQGGVVWGQSLKQNAQLPSPEFWGWNKKAGGGWTIHWTDLSPIPDVCKELCKCSCKKECSGRCS